MFYDEILRMECHGLVFEGISAGVDQYGNLQIKNKNQKLKFSTGEIK